MLYSVDVLPAVVKTKRADVKVPDPLSVFMGYMC